ncbi:hypothetical protein N2152v2_006200 [Parachlorella kessleri]
MELEARVLGSLAEALLPSLPERAKDCIERDGDPLSAQLYLFGGSDHHGFMLKALEIIERRLPGDVKKGFKTFLHLLGSRWGTVLAVGLRVGSWGLPVAFVDLPRQQREEVLVQWARSPNPKLRQAFSAVKGIIVSAVFGSLDGNSDLMAALRYPATDPSRPPAPIPQALSAEHTIKMVLTDLQLADDSPAGITGAGAALALKGLRVLWPTKVRSAAIRAQRPHLVVECDAVVVGSGAGGGVAAARLAAAGLKVVVLEKGRMEGEALEAMYEKGGTLATEDGKIAVMAGSTLGGGTRVNWAASWRTPTHVRREWAEQHGLPDFASDRYDQALDAVCSRLTVHAGHSHGRRCGMLKTGLERLGAQWGDTPRNCLSTNCSGHCQFGCAGGYKQDALVTWLADACQQDCRVVTGVWADKIITEAHSEAATAANGSSIRVARKKRAVGVLALAGNREHPLRLVIQAPVVVSSCGTIHSPALLLRSGIKCQGNVGAHLRLHPVACVVGIFPPDPVSDAQAAQGAALQDVEDLGNSSAPQHGTGTVNCWEGGMMLTYSKQVAHWEDGGYGALLYTATTHPMVYSLMVPWIGGGDYKDLLLQFNNQCTMLPLLRDQSAGRVVIDDKGMPRLRYTLAKVDQERLLEALELGLRCLAAAGAKTLLTTDCTPEGRFSFDATPAGNPYTTTAAAVEASSAGKVAALESVAERGASEGSHQDGVGRSSQAAAGDFGEAFEEFLARFRRQGLDAASRPLFSAHQMGTCRLGSDPKTSVLDPRGECWEVAGLYCLDASTFPTASGVNPMITIESISYMLATTLAEHTAAALKRGGKRGTAHPAAKASTANRVGLAYDAPEE